MRLPSNTPPLLFDTALRARRRTLRADPKSAFLHEVALDEVKERLTDVKKSFTRFMAFE